jgi:quercetin dioxygenase-like cupin family protein
MADLSNSVIFPRGGKLPEPFCKFFKGQAYLHMLNGANEFNCPIGNVTFEPGCRNNWHQHGGGQILLVTGGRGWYQEWGKEARELRPGDVVTIPANVKHWHGAAKDSWFVHLSIETNIQAGPAEWLEPVSDADYNKLP